MAKYNTNQKKNTMKRLAWHEDHKIKTGGGAMDLGVCRGQMIARYDSNKIVMEGGVLI